MKMQYVRCVLTDTPVKEMREDNKGLAIASIAFFAIDKTKEEIYEYLGNKLKAEIRLKPDDKIEDFFDVEFFDVKNDTNFIEIDVPSDQGVWDYLPVEVTGENNDQSS